MRTTKASGSEYGAFRKSIFAEIKSPAEARGIIENQLKAAIESGALQPGARLKQQLIADAFNVSRMPVREVLRRLEAQGYVISIPNRGCLVAATLPGSQNTSLSQQLNCIRELYQQLSSDDERSAFEAEILAALRGAD